MDGRVEIHKAVANGTVGSPEWPFGQHTTHTLAAVIGIGGEQLHGAGVLGIADARRRPVLRHGGGVGHRGRRIAAHRDVIIVSRGKLIGTNPLELNRSD